jgi:hypothetical protein
MHEIFDSQFWFPKEDFHPATAEPRRRQVRIEHEGPIDERGAIVEVTDDTGERVPACGERDRILFA